MALGVLGLVIGWMGSLVWWFRRDGRVGSAAVVVVICD